MDPSTESAGTQYFRWFYDQRVWKRMHYRGMRILKMPSGLWNYQELFIEHRVEWVLETGTRHGGSALFFADLLQLNGARGQVINIDLDRASNVVGAHPRIDFLLGDSVSSTSEVARAIEQGGVFIDGQRLSDPSLRVFSGKILVAQIGERRFARIRIS